MEKLQKIKNRFIEVLTTQLFAMFLTITLLYINQYKLLDKVIENRAAECYHLSVSCCVLLAGIGYIIYSMPIIILFSLIDIKHRMKLIVLQIYFVVNFIFNLIIFFDSFISTVLWNPKIHYKVSGYTLLSFMIINFFFLVWYLKPKKELYNDNL